MSYLDTQLDLYLPHDKASKLIHALKPKHKWNQEFKRRTDRISTSPKLIGFIAFGGKASLHLSAQAVIVLMVVTSRHRRLPVANSATYLWAIELHKR